MDSNLLKASAIVTDDVETRKSVSDLTCSKESPKSVSVKLKSTNQSPPKEISKKELTVENAIEKIEEKKSSPKRSPIHKEHESKKDSRESKESKESKEKKDQKSSRKSPGWDSKEPASRNNVNRSKSKSRSRSPRRRDDKSKSKRSKRDRTPEKHRGILIFQCLNVACKTIIIEFYLRFTFYL